MSYTHEVYIVKFEGEIKYVGEGIKGRHKHVTSGISNIYELNKHHFNGDKLEIEVFPKKNKVSAFREEKRLINKYNPAYNKTSDLLYNFRGKFRRLKNTYFADKLNKPYCKFLEYVIANTGSDFKVTLDTKRNKDFYQHIRRCGRNPVDKFGVHSYIESMSRVATGTYEVKLKMEFVEDPIGFVKSYKQFGGGS